MRGEYNTTGIVINFITYFLAASKLLYLEKEYRMEGNLKKQKKKKKPTLVIF